jgi:hypothetical protein
VERAPGRVRPAERASGSAAIWPARRMTSRTRLARLGRIGR